MGLVQIQKHTGRIDRVYPGYGPPVIELDLAADHEIISVELKDHRYDSLRQMERVTSDWSYVVFTAWRA